MNPETHTPEELRAHQLRLELDCLRVAAFEAAKIAPNERTDQERAALDEWEHVSGALHSAEENTREELDHALKAEGLTD